MCIYKIILHIYTQMRTSQIISNHTIIILSSYHWVSMNLNSAKSFLITSGWLWSHRPRTDFFCNHGCHLDTFNFTKHCTAAIYTSPQEKVHKVRILKSTLANTPGLKRVETIKHEAGTELDQVLFKGLKHDQQTFPTSVSWRRFSNFAGFNSYKYKMHKLHKITQHH